MARPAKIERGVFLAKYMAAHAAGKTGKELSGELGMTPVQFSQKVVQVRKWVAEKGRVLPTLKRADRVAKDDPELDAMLATLDTIPDESGE